MQQVEKNRALAIRWRNAWAIPSFRIKSIVGAILLMLVLVSFPTFFAHIELRKGIVLNDWLLQQLPAVDFSALIFIIIWSTALLLIIRLTNDPDLFLLYLIAFLLLCISRIITISFFALDPPTDLIALKDPVTSIFYGGKNIFISKDLFYSGHTATQFLMFLILPKRTDKLITAITTIAIAVLVLVQHIHYTIDVLAAFPFTYFVYRLSKKIVAF